MPAKPTPSGLTEIEIRVIKMLTKRPMRCSDVGSELWYRSGPSISCSNPWSRPAGKIIRGLERKGYVRKVAIPHGHPGGFYWKASR